MTLRGLNTVLLALFVSGLFPAPSGADERSTARRYERAKRDEPSLIAFLRPFPKGGDLHNHAGGAIWGEYGIAEAVKHGLFFDPATNQFTRTRGPGAVPADELLRNSRLRSQYLNVLSTRGVEQGPAGGHDHFFDTFGYIDSAWQGTDDAELLAPIVRQARIQNLQYLELMMNPHVPARRRLAGAVGAGGTPEQMLARIEPLLPEYVREAKAELDRLDRRTAELAGQTPPLSGVAGPLTVRYLISASRLAPDREILVTWASAFAVMREDPRVVGVNFVAPEDAPPSQSGFNGHMALLEFLWNRFGHPNVTLHAGELNPWVSPLPDMTFHIRKSVEVGHAKRIGHGNAVMWEDDCPGLLRKMREQGVAVEVCPTSEAVILGEERDRHPFHLYWDAGVPVTLNTDDEAVLRTNLTLEFVKAARDWGLSYADLKKLARNSLEYSFLPGESLFEGHDYRRVRKEYAALKTRGWSPNEAERELLKHSDKAAVQVRQERAFLEFEK